MNLTRIFAFVSILGTLFAVSCSSEAPKTTADEAKPAEKKEVTLYTARPCLEKMTYQALRWQSDALPYHLESQANAEANGQDGKSSVWSGNFVSPSRGLSKTFVCSGSRLKNSPPFGVTSNREFPGTTTMTFPPTDLAVDSDAVAKLSQDHGGADLIKKDAKQPVYYELGVDAKSHKLIWAAIFGSSQKDNKGIGLIDATSPKFIGVLKR